MYLLDFFKLNFLISQIMRKLFQLSFIQMIFLSIFLYACSDSSKEEEREVPIKKASSLTPKDIGEYHNKVITLFFKENKGEKNDIFEIENRIISLMKKNYPDLMKDFSKESGNYFLKHEYVIRTDNNISFDLNSYMFDNLERLVSNKKISEEFSKEIISLMNSEDLSYEEILYRVKKDKDIASNSFEKEFIDVFENTLSSSYEFWSNYKETKAPLPKSSKVILADAGGAAVGLFGGPLWSIIQGAIVSVACDV